MTTADNNSRQKLLDRREALKLRLERQRVSAQFRASGRLLCEGGVKFSKLVPLACQNALSKFAALPMRDERFYWPDIAGSHIELWEDDAARDRLLTDALNACTSADEKLALIWHPYEAGMRIRARDLAANASTLLEGVKEVVWIVAAQDSQWLIEIAPLDAEICFTKI